ncbi:MAG: FG-GAP repeat domain-containing protein [Candidatus Freyrarchaeum guaymaensis]
MSGIKITSKQVLKLATLFLLILLPILAIPAAVTHSSMVPLLLPQQPAAEKQPTNVTGFPIHTSHKIFSSPALGDIDGDGYSEIIIGETTSGYVWAFNHDGTNVTGWPVKIGDAVYPSPALGDIDGDGKVEVVVGSYEGTEGWIWAFNSPGTYSEDYPWPMFHHDAQNTGLYVPRAGAAFPVFLLIYILLLMKQPQQMSSLIF